jgi:hypothetical protein
VDARADDLLRRFAAAEGGELTGLSPTDGDVEVTRAGRTARLHFDGVELTRLLRGAGRSGTEAWGEPLTDEEAAARFLSLHLAESLATREAHPTGWWEYRGGGFDPLPPWEASASRGRRS